MSTYAYTCQGIIIMATLARASPLILHISCFSFLLHYRLASSTYSNLSCIDNG